MVRSDYQAWVACVLGMRLDPAGGVGEESMDQEANMALVLALGFSLFLGQPEWYELDTRGVDWTVYECHVAKDGVCLIDEQEAYDALADSHSINQEESR